MRDRFSIFVLAFAAILTESCIYPFTPDLENVDIGLFVIEGDILVGAESYISVRRSLPLNDTINRQNSQAGVWLESDKGEIVQGRFLWEDRVYLIDTRNLDPYGSYRLHVVPPGYDYGVGSSYDSDQAGGKEYVTEWLEVLITPELEALSFKVDELSEKITFHVSTTNPDTNPYYKWNCHEVWEYTSQYYAMHEFVTGSNIVRENLRENRYFCWDRATVSEIMTASTEALKENRLVDHKIYELPFMSDKLALLYSAEVTQSSISAEAYAYWEVISRNTDQTGSIFSPQPSELRGNIYNMYDSTEVVLGYISASTISSRKIYVSADDFPMQNRRINCGEMMPIPLNEGVTMKKYYYWGYDVVYVDEMERMSYWSEKRCVDCRVKGGTKNKPDDWPNEHHN